MGKERIITKTYQLEEKVYFKIMVRTRFLKFGWLYVTVLILALWHLNDWGRTAMATFLVVFGFLYPITTFLYLYFWTTSRKNKGLFGQRILEFDEGYLMIKGEEGLETRLAYNKINKIVETRTFFLLYVDRNQFIYVPKNSFRIEAHLLLFRKRVKAALEG